MHPTSPARRLPRTPPPVIKTRMPNRIDEKFASLRAASRSGFVAYVTAGDPSPAHTASIVLALEAAGVDFIELGIPFSDPLADGATIQAASGRAIAAGTSVARVLEIVREIRRTSSLPIILFTYLNPVYIFGYEAFHREAAEAGADGLLVLDLPPDEAVRNAELSLAHGLLPIQLIAPTTPPARMELIARAAGGFIYYVSREGVTGEQSSLPAEVASQVAEIRRHTSLPIAVGFGISTPAQAGSIARDSDAVVVGSAIVRQIAEHGTSPDLVDRLDAFVRPIAESIHNARG